MFGSGTTMLACMLGRNVIGVELEQKFVDMAKANWEKVKMRPQLGSAMGECQIIQGDARQLEGLVDKVITSPPYAEAQSGGGIAKKGYQGPKHGPTDLVGKRSYMPENIGGENNISNLPYGQIDKIVTSPPYAEGLDGAGQNKGAEGAISIGDIKAVCKELGINHASENMPAFRQKMRERRRQYVDSIITSPPYEGSVSASTGGERDMASARQREKRLLGKGYNPAKYQGGVGRNLEVDFQYSKDTENIGNLKSDSYLSAMLQVYQQCHKVLRPGGLMILVTKNFIRNKQVVRLDTDTIKLCEQAGFTYLERHYRKLPSQSFWRIIYHQKHPEVEQILNEDVLVFNKKEDLTNSS